MTRAALQRRADRRRSRFEGRVFTMSRSGHLGDRRQAARFELMASVWGSLAGDQPLCIRNLGRGGVLVESPLALPARSLHSLRLRLEHRASEVKARVCHVRATVSASGVPVYLVGFEFLDLAAADAEQIDRLVDQSGDSAVWR